MLVHQTFLYKNGPRSCRHPVVNGERTLFTNEETSAGKKYDEILICQMIDFLIDNIYINLFLYSYKVEFLRSMEKSNKNLAKAFNITLY